MAQNSKIEWCTHTANLWWGCTKVHEGCDNCYAETLSNRWNFDIWGNHKPRRIINSVWKDLSKYQKLAKEAGETHRVFVGSMMDIFEKPMPLVDSKGNIVEGMDTGELRNVLFHNIYQYPNLLFLFLTKRPSNINKYIPDLWKDTPPKNVMFGTSPVNEETCKTLIPQLMKVNGKRFLSIEPQLSEIEITNFKYHYGSIGRFCKSCTGKGYYSDNFNTPCPDCGRTGITPWGIDWIIQGGESGSHKRPFNLDWAYKLKANCLEEKIPYFFKQIDKVQSIPEDLMARQFPI